MTKTLSVPGMSPPYNIFKIDEKILYLYNINMNKNCIFEKGRNIVYLGQVDNKEKPGAGERVVELVIVLPMSALDHLEYLLLITRFMITIIIHI